jgi:hypothetical protein
MKIAVSATGKDIELDEIKLAGPAHNGMGQ